MGPRWTALQVILLGAVTTSLAQNSQSPGDYQFGQFLPTQQTQPVQTTSQRFLPQRQFQSPQFQQQTQEQYSDEQKETVRAQQEFRKSIADANRFTNDNPVRTPLQTQQFVDQTPPQTVSLPPPVLRAPIAPVQTVQVRPRPQSSQGFNVPQQVRSQTPLRQFDQPRTVQRPQLRKSQRQNFDQQQFQPVQTIRHQKQPITQQFLDEQENFQRTQPPFVQPQQSLQQEPIVVSARRPVQQSFTKPQQEPVSLRTPQHQGRPSIDEELFKQQAETAKYSFSTAVTDGINDNQHLREETRDGLNLKGMYSYSDGFFRRTVHYEADENGYRIVNEEVEPIGDGPISDPNGRADVSSNIHGNKLQYSITTADIQPQEQQQF